LRRGNDASSIVTVAPTVTALPGPSGPPTSREGRPTDEQRPPIIVGFVNNMPDSAFADTEAQFTSLLAAGGSSLSVHVRRYAMASVERGVEVQPLLASYRDAAELYSDPPDALIITGTEPRCPDLRQEPYWDELSNLLQWSQSSVNSVLLSCLAAHASVLAVDGLPRTPLRTKCFGVFPQRVRQGHPLARGLRSVAFPHSRLNEVRTDEVRGIGYDVLAESPTAGWTVAARETSGTLTVMFQGHPEYSRDTLLREHRRDVRRFLAGERETYPAIPVGYMDHDGEALLTHYREDVTSRATDASLIAAFPFDLVLQHVTANWQVVSHRLVSNWLATIEQSRTPAGR
jgi:homoserine O-succinyltransferase/O-acetyltransferase